MNLDLTPEQIAFRDGVRAFIRARLPEDIKQRLRQGHLPRKQDSVTWQRILAERGWAAPHWPRAYGGAELGQMERLILLDELYRAPAPLPQVFNINMLGPVLLQYGTPAQREHFLPRLANLDLWFCQGFSEPDAGSDLASLRTAARREGDVYVVNGQKTWTSTAHWADWIFALVRTDPAARKQAGISFLLIDLKSPGVTIRPIRSIDGSCHLNEVFFENVRVPARNRVGEENRGWYIGTTTLDFERSSIGSAVGIHKQLEGIMKFAKDHPKLSVGANKREVQMALADRWIEANVAKLMSYRVISMQNAGLIPNHEASMCKLFTSEMGLRIAALGVKLTGLYAMVTGGVQEYAAAGRYGFGYVNAVSSTIAGGTSEIQRNIMAQRGLGLPRD